MGVQFESGSEIKTETASTPVAETPSESARKEGSPEPKPFISLELANSEPDSTYSKPDSAEPEPKSGSEPEPKHESNLKLKCESDLKCAMTSWSILDADFVVHFF